MKCHYNSESILVNIIYIVPGQNVIQAIQNVRKKVIKNQSVYSLKM
jgi:hypothetical protein